MGAFDDLIPKTQEGGLFDDLTPSKPIRFMEEPTAMDKFLGSLDPKWSNFRGTAGARVLQGMADPMIGAMQTVANILPDSTGIPQAVNKRVGDLEKDYEAQRRASAPKSITSLVTDKPEDLGTDWARIGGNLLSPVNAIPMVEGLQGTLAVTKGGRALQGAGFGAAAGAMEPVADTSKGFWGAKAGQIGTGAASGAVLTPVLGAVGDIVARRLATASPANLAARSSMEVDKAINDALQDLGQTIHDLPPAQVDALRAQVSQALGQGKTMDPAAAMRAADFKALDMQPTLGQITRDPMQFAREQNLRGVEGVGEPLSARFQDQGVKLARRLSEPAAEASDAYTAGGQLRDALKSTDETLRKHVSGLYGEARASAGKDLDVPLQGLAQDYARVLEDFGDKVPTALRMKFGSWGMDPAVPGNQRKVFTLEDANKLVANINEHVGSDVATNRALYKLRSAVQDAVHAVDAEGGPFAPAVRAAAERFKLHDAVPALKSAAEGSVAPDDFVRRFVVNGKTDEVKGLANVLKQANPDAFNQARAQIADELRRAAFGEQIGMDASFAPSRYMQAVRRMGTQKLGAFFSPEEVDQLLRVGRVGAYMKQAPNASAVNRSNTTSAAANLFARIPGMGPAVAIGNKVAGTVKNGATVRNALAASIPMKDAPLPDGPRNYLAYLLALSGSGLASREVGR